MKRQFLYSSWESFLSGDERYEYYISRNERSGVWKLHVRGNCDESPGFTIDSFEDAEQLHELADCLHFEPGEMADKLEATGIPALVQLAGELRDLDG